MALLDRKALLAKEKLEVTKVDLGDGNYVFVRQMTGRERDRFEQSLIKENKNAEGGYEKTLEDFRAKLAVCTVSDEDGNLILQPGDFGILSQNMSAAKLEKIINTAQRINKISEDDKENLVKNSEAVQDGNSTSDSVEN
jgi:hypothetical protein